MRSLEVKKKIDDERAEVKLNVGPYVSAVSRIRILTDPRILDPE